jgi:hypothetical protein
MNYYKEYVKYKKDLKKDFVFHKPFVINPRPVTFVEWLRFQQKLISKLIKAEQ